MCLNKKILYQINTLLLFALLGTTSLLFCKCPVLSQFFFSLTPENFKDRKVFQVSKGMKETSAPTG